MWLMVYCRLIYTLTHDAMFGQLLLLYIREKNLEIRFCFCGVVENEAGNISLQIQEIQA